MKKSFLYVIYLVAEDSYVNYDGRSRPTASPVLVQPLDKNRLNKNRPNKPCLGIAADAPARLSNISTNSIILLHILFAVLFIRSMEADWWRPQCSATL